MSGRPNIVFILTDQFRSDCLSVLGHPVVRTPNLDHLAKNGTIFSNAYSPCPSCIAARASIFTGLTPSTHGRLGYQDKVPWNYANMLPAVLGRAGYQTHCVGKTHFYPQRAHCGFDSLDSYEAAQNLDGDYVNDYWEWLHEKTGGRLHEYDHGLDSNSWNARPSALPEELHNNTWVVTKGIEFVHRRDRTRPFFLNLSFHRPHPPIDPPQAFWDMYRDVPLPKVPVGEWARIHDTEITNLNAWHGRLAPDLLDRARRAYYAQIAHIDNQIGRFILALKRMQAGPTIFIFTADHGEMLGDHHLFRKTYAYEGSAGVPLIISAPEQEKNGICPAPVVLQDIYPTILEFAGIQIPAACEGMSLACHTRGQEPAHKREFIHGEHSRCYDDGEAMQFLTDGVEKYIWYTATGREQLFHLQSDPGELIDLASDPAYGQRLELWRERMAGILAQREQDKLTEGNKLTPGILLPAVRDWVADAP